MGHQFLSPSKRGGLCSFDLHIGGGSSDLYTSYKKILIGIHQYKLVNLLM